MKGYIYEMAMRLEDEEDRIANLAKLFFHELSKKGEPIANLRILEWDCLHTPVFKQWSIIEFILIVGSNPVYNLLPDIMGKLSSQNLNGESFCNIMQFLIGSIKKVLCPNLLRLSVCNLILVCMFADLLYIFRINKWKLLWKSFAIGSLASQVWIQFL